jgi:hypothetical protein
MTGAKWCTERIAGFEPRLLQTGTGTAQTTAISTAAITAVIFSLVDRSMVSSGSDANLQRPPYTRAGDYAVTWITLRPALPLFRDQVWLLPRD